jgi:hypothetical protein
MGSYPSKQQQQQQQEQQHLIELIRQRQEQDQRYHQSLQKQEQRPQQSLKVRQEASQNLMDGVESYEASSLTTMGAAPYHTGTYNQPRSNAALSVTSVGVPSAVSALANDPAHVLIARSLGARHGQ